MAITPTSQRLRVKGDSSVFTDPVNKLTSAALGVWCGANARIEVGLYQNGSVVDPSTISTLTLEIKPLAFGNKPPSPSTTPLLQKVLATGDLDATVDDASWLDDSKEHAVFEMTAVEMNLSAGVKWFVIHALLTSGDRITFVAGEITFYQDGAPSVSTPPTSEGQTYYTQDEADALFAMLTPADGNYRIKDGTTLQLYDTGTSGFRSIWLVNGVIAVGASES